MGRSLLRRLGALGFALLLVSCTSHDLDPRPGPDKQGIGLVTGAASGAGAGAITGFQLGAATGPGAAVGAGLGAVAGSLRGLTADLAEEEAAKLAAATHDQRERAVVHELLHDHYQRRISLHPTRDIYPADWFFDGDGSRLKPGAEAIVTELTRLNRHRLPYSRLVVTVYSKANEHNREGGFKASNYAEHLSTRRAREIVNYMIRAGAEPRRLEARGMVVGAPVLVDPDDDPLRYAQAVEITPIDR